VWMMAGPPTKQIRPLRALISRMVPASSRITSCLGFSGESELVVNPKISLPLPRSTGVIRTPARPTTTRSPAWTSLTGTARAAPPAITTPQSISISSTDTHRPPNRTAVGWLVVV